VCVCVCVCVCVRACVRACVCVMLFEHGPVVLSFVACISLCSVCDVV
jgi:hypothetical protein